MGISSLLFHNRLEIKPTTVESIDVGELGAFGFIGAATSTIFSCVKGGGKSLADSDLVWMKELFQDGKPVKHQRPMTEKEKNHTDKKRLV